MAKLPKKNRKICLSIAKKKRGTENKQKNHTVNNKPFQFDFIIFYWKENGSAANYRGRRNDCIYININMHINEHTHTHVHLKYLFSHLKSSML